MSRLIKGLDITLAVIFVLLPGLYWAVQSSD